MSIFERRTVRGTLATVTGLLLVVVACGAGSAPERGDSESQRADFRLESLDGDRVGPPDYSGKVVVADFWATWCAPCRIQTEVLESLHAEYSADEVQFLAINLGEDREEVTRFVEDEPFAYPVLLDTDEEVGNELGLVALPTVLIVDAEGVISYLESGIVPEERLRELIDEARG